jgi:hypothetical protein
MIKFCMHFSVMKAKIRLNLTENYRMQSRSKSFPLHNVKTGYDVRLEYVPIEIASRKNEQFT